ncbi:hypothetical protein JTE90_022814 [Oedothorax gibbosus]|uniref:Uncharacterized protein n=1 Tax=Oedothorax gibbosus TaxID=931172 RepID=A0AAV6V6M7_9ARAC|nr:hypothetical protein JTE90_022814 [Oedothorax gibbosus]
MGMLWLSFGQAGTSGVARFLIYICLVGRFLLRHQMRQRRCSVGAQRKVSGMSTFQLDCGSGKLWHQERKVNSKDDPETSEADTLIAMNDVKLFANVL